ncbi:hypothetical protein [Dactylosporangium sp. NPDC051541]|uniref:hypothetical protein n=1 Tax=Dactylosporangium sp. NPDC051541 TaxID=3363977 RepID=UPI003792973C
MSEEPFTPARPAPPDEDEAPAPAAPPPSAPPPYAPPRRPAWGRWPRDGRRGGLLIALVALVVGCCLGAGVVAVGAVVFGHHGPPGHSRFDRDGRDGYYRGGDPRDNRGPGPGPGPGYGRPGDRRPPAPTSTTAPAPTTAAPTPTAS